MKTNYVKNKVGKSLNPHTNTSTADITFKHKKELSLFSKLNFPLKKTHNTLEGRKQAAARERELLHKKQRIIEIDWNGILASGRENIQI